MPGGAARQTALVVLVPEADALVADIYRTRTVAGSAGMRPHVTLVVPFVPRDDVDPPMVERLRALFARFSAFEFELASAERWRGVLFLAPVPSAPFVSLSEALVDAFPGYPPYAGIHETIVPHLTVATGADAALAELREELWPDLPIRCRAEAATLVAQDDALRWRVHVQFRFARVE